MCAAWHHCLESLPVSQEKSFLASAGTANLLKLCLWHQQFDLREGWWRFWAELNLRLQQCRSYWGQQIALRNKPALALILHHLCQNPRKLDLLLLLPSPGESHCWEGKESDPTSCQLWDEGSLALQQPFSGSVTSVLSLFCVKSAVALNPVHHCPFTGTAEFRFSCATEKHSPVLGIDSKDHSWSRAIGMLPMWLFMSAGTADGKKLQADRPHLLLLNVPLSKV